MPPEADENQNNGAGTGASGGNVNDDENTGGRAAGGNEADNEDDGEDFDKPRALNTIRTLRQKESTLTQQIKEANAKLKQLEDADKSERQRLEERVTELTTRLEGYEAKEREATQREAFTSAASKANALESKFGALWKLAQGDLQFEDDGTPKNATAVLKSLKEDYPEFFVTTSADGGAGRGRQPQTASMSDAIRSSLRR